MCIGYEETEKERGQQENGREKERKREREKERKREREKERKREREKERKREREKERKRENELEDSLLGREMIKVVCHCVYLRVYGRVCETERRDRVEREIK